MTREDIIRMKIGDKIRCKSWKDLKRMAMYLSAEGYGVAIVGYTDIDELILTISALPKEN